MERPLHRPDRARDRRGDVRARRGDDPGGERRRVEAVLGTDDEVGVERPRRAGVRAGARELVQVALDEVERRVRIDRLLAGAEPDERGECRRRERRQGSGMLDGRWPRQVLGGAPGRDRGPQRVHRLRRGRQRPEDVHDRARDPRRSRGDGRDPTRRSTAGSRRPDTCRARRGRRSGSRDRSGGRSRHRPWTATSHRRGRPRGPASRDGRRPGQAGWRSRSRSSSRW